MPAMLEINEACEIAKEDFAERSYRKVGELMAQYRSASGSVAEDASVFAHCRRSRGIEVGA